VKFHSRRTKAFDASGSVAALIIAAAIAIAPTISSAQTSPPTTPPLIKDFVVPTTKVLAIGHFTAKATPAVWQPYVDSEVRQTVELYLAGKIEQWWVKPDQSGVVFLFNLSDPNDAKQLLERLPMGKAGLMEFELIPLGPLSPLRLLLAEPKR
jgi:muconolactone delta-isomerase